MDEKPADSRPPNDLDEKSTETTSTGVAFDDLTPGDTHNGDWTFVTQAHYDPDEPRDLTTVIISAIAEAEEAPITEIESPPLYEVVDVASIDGALFGRPTANRAGTATTVEFRYKEYKVSIEADGWVTVSNRRNGAEPDEE